jgi:hypothetical protein
MISPLCRFVLLWTALLVAALPVSAQRFPIPVNTVADLRTLNPNNLNTNYTLLGYRSLNDGGGGLFSWYPGSVTATNLGTIFSSLYPGASGRFIRQFSGSLNVRWFGATGDGVTDDSLALQGAIDTIPSTGGDVFLPGGNYSFSTGLNFPRAIKFFGENTTRYALITRLSYTGAGTAITISANYCQVSGINLTTSTGSIGIDCSGYHALAFDFTGVQGFSSSAYKLNDTFFTHWEDCFFQPKDDPAAKAIDCVDNFNANLIQDCIFTAADTYTGTFIDINTAGVGGSSAGSTISQNDFNGAAYNATAIRLRANAKGISLIGNRQESPMKWLQIDDNSFGHAVMGNEIAGTSGVRASTLINIDGGDVYLSGNSYSESTNGLVLSGLARRVTYVRENGLANINNLVVNGATDQKQVGFIMSTNSQLPQLTARSQALGTDPLRAVSSDGDVLAKFGEELTTGRGYIQAMDATGLANWHLDTDGADSYNIGGFLGLGTTDPTSILELFEDSAGPELRLSRDAGTLRGSVTYGRHNSGTFQTSALIDGISDASGNTNGVVRFRVTDGSGALVSPFQLASSNLLTIATVPYRFPMAGAAGALSNDGANNLSWSLFYGTIQDEGIDLTKRTTINFVGAGVSAADSGGVTTVTIPGGGGGATNAIVSLNGLTNTIQYLVTGTTGTDFTITNNLNDTHIFNLPFASATSNGKLSLTNWTTFNNKQDAFTTGLGITNVANVLSNNVVAGANITITAGGSGQLTIASTASGTGAPTNTLVSLSTPAALNSIWVASDTVGTNATAAAGAVLDPALNSTTLTLTRQINDTFGPNIIFQKRGTTGDSNSVAVTGNPLGNVLFEGWDGSAYGLGAEITAVPTENFDGSGHGTKLQFFTTDNNSLVTQSRFEILADGPVKFLASTAPTTDAVAEWAMDSNLWGANRGAFQYFDGTSNAVVVAYTANDPPTTGDIPIFNGSHWTNVPSSSFTGGGVGTNALFAYQERGSGTDFNYLTASDLYQKIDFGTSGPGFTITNAGSYQIVATLASFDASTAWQSFYLTNVTDGVHIAGPFKNNTTSPTNEYWQVNFNVQVTTTGANKAFEFWGKTLNATYQDSGVSATNSIVDVIAIQGTNSPAGTSDNWTASGTTNSTLSGTAYLHNLLATNDVTIGTSALNILRPSTVGASFLEQLVVRDYLQLTNSGLTPSTAVYLDAAKKIATVSTVSDTELGYLANVTSDLQTQLNAKQASFTTGLGITNVANVLSNNIVAGANITITAGTDGQLSIAGSAGGGSAPTNTLVSLSTPSTSGGVFYASDTIGTNATVSASHTLSGTNASFQGILTLHGLVETNGPINILNPPYSATGDGTTDDTTALNTAIVDAFTTGRGTVLIPPTASGYVFGNIFLTNNVTVTGLGGKPYLKFKLGTAGIMFDASMATNVTISNLELEGGTNTTWKGFSTPGTRSGISLFSYGWHNRIRDCDIHGFSNRGIMLTNSSGISNEKFAHAKVSGCNIYYVHTGVDLTYSGGHGGGDAEYTMVTGSSIGQCYNGVLKNAGNVIVSNNEISNCTFGVDIGGTVNPAHGITANNLINHCTTPLRAVSTPYGETVTGNTMFAGNITLTSCIGLLLANNTLDLDGGMTFSGAGVSWIRDNAFRALPTITWSATDQIIFDGQNRRMADQTYVAWQQALSDFYPFEESTGTRFDLMGGNHLTANGTVPMTTGLIAHGVSFAADGANYLSSASSDFDYADTIYSIGCYVKPATSGTNYVLISRDTAAGAERGFALSITNSNVAVWTVYNGASVIGTVTSGATTLSSGTWYWLGVYHDSTANTVGLSVNGAAFATSATTGAAGSTTASELRIGVLGDGTSPFNGVIDEVMFWPSRKLTATEGIGLYHGGSGRKIIYDK